MDKLLRFAASLFVFGITILSTSAIAAAPDFAAKPEFSAKPDLPVKPKFPLMQGPTSDTVAQFAAVVPKDSNFRYRLVAGDKIVHPTKFDKFFDERSDFKTEQTYFEGLTLGTEYKLQLYNVRNEVLDERLVHTLDVQKPTFRPAFISCSADYFRSREPMWNAVKVEDPDVLFLLGDNVYAGLWGQSLKPYMVWKRYVETRHKLNIFFARKLIPMFAIWDDHDTGGDNTDRTFEHLKGNLRVFYAFFPRYPVPGVFEPWKGTASAITAFGAKFIMMDSRTFREPPGIGEVARVWGKEQYEWLLQHIDNTATPLFFMNGTQVLGKSEESIILKDKATLEHLLRQLRRVPAPVVFVSGDVHYSEILSIDRKVLGYDTIEITSSSIHSFTGFGHDMPNDNRRLMGTLKYNFITGTVNVGPGLLDMNLRAVTRENKELFQFSNLLMR